MDSNLYEATHGLPLKIHDIYRCRNATRVIGNVLLELIKEIHCRTTEASPSYDRFKARTEDLTEALEHLDGSKNK